MGTPPHPGTVAERASSYFKGQTTSRVLSTIVIRDPFCILVRESKIQPLSFFLGETHNLKMLFKEFNYLRIS